MAVTKEKIIDAVYRQGVMSRSDARGAVDRLLAILKDTLAAEEDVLISGFGKFEVKRKKARRGRNPQTKEELILKARRVVTFSTSGILRRKLNDDLN